MDSWEAGDIAECIDDRWGDVPWPSPKLGQRLMVSEVDMLQIRCAIHGHHDITALVLIGMPKEVAYLAPHFRKYHPPEIEQQVPPEKVRADA